MLIFILQSKLIACVSTNYHDSNKAELIKNECSYDVQKKKNLEDSTSTIVISNSRMKNTCLATSPSFDIPLEVSIDNELGFLNKENEDSKNICIDTFENGLVKNHDSKETSSDKSSESDNLKTEDNIDSTSEEEDYRFFFDWNYFPKPETCLRQWNCQRSQINLCERV